MNKQNHQRRAAPGVRGWAGLLLALFLLGMLAAPVLALAYRFAVPVASADIFINEDGTATVQYIYVFDNSGDPIDAVDIGVPTSTFDMNSISATLDGRPAGNIADSPYVDPGFAVELTNAIPNGQRGELRVTIGKVERILFKASADEAEPYASFQFQPNYFGSEFVTGRTDMTVTLHLPPGLAEQEPRFFTPQGWPGNDTPDQTGFDEQGRVFYQWHSASASASDQYTFGASFPARLVPEGVLLTEVPGWLNSDVLCPAIFCLGFFAFMGFTIWAGIQGDRKRRLQYLPPKVAVEGNGIKRGLTSVEAAILMQQPMDKILTMILFSVIKKGAARVVSQEPMKLEVTNPLPEGLRAYETDFLTAMILSKAAEQRRGLQEMMTNLVKGVSEKMRGFSRKETVTYYQDIMTKAWQQVEQAQTPEMKMQAFDDAMDWTMLDKRFPDRTREVFGPRPVIVPGWWGGFDPRYGTGGIGRASTASSGPTINTSGNNPPTGVNLPSLPGADFAGSLVGGMQSFASNVVGDLTAFTGGVTNKTNPVPKPSPSSSSRGGGGGGGRSCACACACAGCACACAGGGR